MQPHAATDEVRPGGALCRLTQSIDVDAVRAWRSRLCTAIPAVNAHYPAAADASLSWAPFDAGVDACFEHWLAREHLQRDMVHDAMHGTVATLLQRGDTQRLARLMPLMLRYAEGASLRFCHWPIADWYHAQGLVPAPDEGSARCTAGRATPESDHRRGGSGERHDSRAALSTPGCAVCSDGHSVRRIAAARSKPFPPMPSRGEHG